MFYYGARTQSEQQGENQTMLEDDVSRDEFLHRSCKVFIQLGVQILTNIFLNSVDADPEIDEHHLQHAHIDITFPATAQCHGRFMTIR